MKQHTTPITGKIVVTQQSPSGIVAEVNGKTTFFQDRESLFRTAVLLAESSIRAEDAHPPPKKGP